MKPTPFMIRFCTKFINCAIFMSKDYFFLYNELVQSKPENHVSHEEIQKETKNQDILVIGHVVESRNLFL